MDKYIGQHEKQVAWYCSFKKKSKLLHYKRTLNIEKISANWIKLFSLCIVKGQNGSNSSVQLPDTISTAKEESTQFQSQAFASPLTSSGMTHRNFLIKKLILGAKCLEKMEKKSLVFWRLDLKKKIELHSLLSYLSNHSSTVSSVMFCCEPREYKTRQKDKRISLIR